MNVAQVTHLYRPSYGGIENYVFRLNESLRADGHGTRTLTTDHSLSESAPYSPPDGVRYYGTNFSLFRNPFSWGLYKGVKETPADLYHLHSPFSLVSLEAAAAMRDETPVVVTMHGVRPYGETQLTGHLERLYRPFANYVFDRCSAVIVLGERERERLLERYDVDPAVVRTIPNGIDLAEYDVSSGDRERFREKYDLRPDVPTVSFVSRLVPKKRPEALIDAFVESLPEARADVLVVGGGDEDYIDSLRDRSDERFTFLRGLPFKELCAVYALSDVFAMLSEAEGLPTVVLEAMYLETAVIGTEAGAMPEVLEGGGVVLGDVTPSRVAETLERYLENPEVRAEHAAHNREVVERRYSWERVYEEIRDVYGSIADANPTEDGSTRSAYGAGVERSP
ncbi:glycosyltransferase family 1 protein [Halobacteriales archaeon QS_6_71_20]|nr:MAG: glycosyltransferase family 1 protein [Halobacteriales archaeon QS_6_71_20]